LQSHSGELLNLTSHGKLHTKADFLIYSNDQIYLFFYSQLSIRFPQITQTEAAKFMQFFKVFGDQSYFFLDKIENEMKIIKHVLRLKALMLRNSINYFSFVCFSENL